MTALAGPGAPDHWAAVNHAYLEAGLHALRLRFKRRILWLRRLWSQDPLESYQAQVVSDAQADQLLAGPVGDAEAQFYAQNPEAIAVGQALATAERALEQRAAACDATGGPPALHLLGRLFGLTAFDRNVLLACLALDLDPGFERLCAYAQDDVRRGYVSPRLVLDLYGAGAVAVSPNDAESGSVPEEAPGKPMPEAASTETTHPSREHPPTRMTAILGDSGSAPRNRFLPDAPLRRHRLISLEPPTMPGAPESARPLCIDPRVADYLRGINRTDERVAHLLRPIPPAPLAPPQRRLVEQLALTLADRLRQGELPLVNLVGPPGSGKSTAARALVERSGWQVRTLDSTRLPQPGPERAELLRLLEREALLTPMAYFIDADDLDHGDQTLRAAVDALIDGVDALLIVGSREGWRGERESLRARMPTLDAADRRALWREALGARANDLDGVIRDLTQQFSFGPRATARIVAEAQQRVRLRADFVQESDTDRPSIAAQDLWAASRDHLSQDLAALAQRIEPAYTWDDIVLPEPTLRQVREIAGQVAQRGRVYDDWGFGAKLKRGRGISALFAGPSGTGKTMAAEVLAHALALDLFRIDLAGVVSKYIGETEKNLKRVFDAAEQSGAILFFDEADALFGKRTEVRDSHDRYANIEVNYLLQRMEDYQGLAILATNRKSALDKAFLRRLRFVVDFPMPDAASRQAIWHRMFPELAAVNGLDYHGLARLDVSGGNIRNIALNAAFLAATEDAHIGMAHLMRAVDGEYAKIDKRINVAEIDASYREQVQL